jgi:hypothetical protein
VAGSRTVARVQRRDPRALDHARPALDDARGLLEAARGVLIAVERRAVRARAEVGVRGVVRLHPPSGQRGTRTLHGTHEVRGHRVLVQRRARRVREPGVLVHRARAAERDVVVVQSHCRSWGSGVVKGRGRVGRGGGRYALHATLLSGRCRTLRMTSPVSAQALEKQE